MSTVVDAGRGLWYGLAVTRGALTRAPSTRGARIARTVWALLGHCR